MPTTAPPTTDATRTFRELTRGDTAFAGDKGAVLGELTRSRFPVPPGFVIGAPAYAAFVDAASLDERVGRALAGRDLDDPRALEAASKRARDAIESALMPAWLVVAVESAYAELGAGTVAVRPSPTVDVTGNGSVAGVYDSFLNVATSADLFDALKRCWSSLFSPHAIRFHASHGLAPAGAQLAVVVQAQVPATVAGVAFTLDPATGNEDRVVVDAGVGLGGGVVSGTVSADRYVVDKGNLVVLSRVLRADRRAVEALDGLTAIRGLAPAETPSQVLTDSELRQLTALALRIEEHFGEAQDLEWACDPDGKFWIVQARPLDSSVDVRLTTRSGGRELVRGLGAAPGRASGRARVVGSLTSPGRLATGEILVAHVTGPDSAPLMHGVAAIVTDTGGMSSYAAVVARHRGIPCVVGTAEGTTVVADGQQITVDGDHGLVLSAPDGPPAG